MARRCTSARSFASASSQYLSLASSPISAYPLTMFCWIWVPDITAISFIQSIGVAGAATNGHRLGINTDETVFYQCRDGGGGNNVTSTGVATLNAWNAVCGVGLSATDRWIFLNQHPGVQSTTSKDPAGMNQYNIAASTSPGNYFDGRIAHAAVWNVALTPAEVRQLTVDRCHPLMIRRGSLVAYHPLGIASPEPGFYTSQDLTVNNAPAMALGPEIEPFVRTRRSYVDVIAAGTAFPEPYYRQQMSA